MTNLKETSRASNAPTHLLSEMSLVFFSCCSFAYYVSAKVTTDEKEREKKPVQSDEKKTFNRYLLCAQVSSIEHHSNRTHSRTLIDERVCVRAHSHSFARSTEVTPQIHNPFFFHLLLFFFLARYRKDTRNKKDSHTNCKVYTHKERYIYFLLFRLFTRKKDTLAYFYAGILRFLRLMLNCKQSCIRDPRMRH